MDHRVRRAASEYALAYADVQRALAEFELEDTTQVASRLARNLDMVCIRGREMKDALRAQIMGQ